MVEQAVRQRVDLPEATEPQRPPTNYPFPSEKKETHPLGEEILSQQGSFRRVRRYYPGWFHPEGLISGVHYWWSKNGWQGQETIVEQDAIGPIRTFKVSGQPEATTLQDNQVQKELAASLSG